jgi:hypothetical protein
MFESALIEQIILYYQNKLLLAERIQACCKPVDGGKQQVHPGIIGHNLLSMLMQGTEEH